MATRKVMEGGGQNVLVQRSAKVDGAPNVIGKVGLRVQRALDPKAFLTERCRQYERAIRLRGTVKQCDRRCTPLLPANREMGGEVGECGVFEDEVERHVGAEGLAEPVGEPG
ncbi:hypothetical protein ACFTZ8_35605, partial [Streptomyces fungicidicus]|uniref:hypothetical protein n=1 Tax=Streptomyces fungicidicus TaxID=68203 RepID=UPI0036258ADB